MRDCPLCGSAAVPFVEAKGRRYFRCPVCQLIHLASEQHPTPDEERIRYELHQNGPDDQGYRGFLDQLTRPLVERLPSGARGLDYGSGPGPTLSVMMEEQGFNMRIYDPYFAPDTGVFEETYDFLTCTETAEHFFSPKVEFDRFNSLLAPGGWLAVMTQFFQEGQVFADWHYVNDPTHVSFYSAETMRWIAGRYGWQMESPSVNVTLFRKLGPGASPLKEAGTGGAALVAQGQTLGSDPR